MANEVFHTFQPEWRTDPDMIICDHMRFLGRPESYLTFVEPLKELPKYRQIGTWDSMKTMIEKNKLMAGIDIVTPLSESERKFVLSIAHATPCPNPKVERSMEYVWDIVKAMGECKLLKRSADERRVTGRQLYFIFEEAKKSIPQFRNSMALFSTAVSATSNRKGDGLHAEFAVQSQHNKPADNIYTSAIGDMMEDEMIRSKVKNFRWGWNRGSQLAEIFTFLKLKNLLSGEAQAHFDTPKEHPQADTEEAFNTLCSVSVLNYYTSFRVSYQEIMGDKEHCCEAKRIDGALGCGKKVDQPDSCGNFCCKEHRYGKKIAIGYGKPRPVQKPVTLMPPHLSAFEKLPAPPPTAPPANAVDNFIASREDGTRVEKTMDPNNHAICREHLPNCGVKCEARELPTYATAAWLKDTIPTTGPDFDFVNIVQSNIADDTCIWYCCHGKKKSKGPYRTCSNSGPVERKRMILQTRVQRYWNGLKEAKSKDMMLPPSRMEEYGAWNF